MRHRFFLLVLCLVVACGDSPPSLDSSTNDTSACSGTFLLASASWAARRGAGYTELWLGTRGTFFWRVVDRAFVDRQFVVQGDLVAGAPGSARLRCKSAQVLGLEESRYEVWYQKRRGKEAEYPPRSPKQKVAEFLESSTFLNHDLPSVFKQCAEGEVSFASEDSRTLLAHATFAGVTYPLENASSGAFARILSGLPRPSAELAPWSEARRVPGLSESFVVTDPRNALVPSAPAHHYFVLALLGSPTIEGERLHVPWRRTGGPRGETDDVELNREVALGRWWVPTPFSVRVWNIDDNGEQLIVSRGLSATEKPESGGELVLALPELPRDLKLRIEIAYDTPSWRAERRYGWQRLTARFRAGVLQDTPGIDARLE